MKTFEDVFSVLLHNFSSKKRKRLILHCFPSAIAEQRPLVPFWGFCPPGTREICRRPTAQREVNEGGVKTIESGEAVSIIYRLAFSAKRIEMFSWFFRFSGDCLQGLCCGGGFYLYACIQGKACRHNIRDEVST